MARGDYLGEVAERYLDDFTDYRRLAKLNRLDDPDRIRPGQLLRLPTEANDQGTRTHATGRLVSRPAAPRPPAPRPAPERTAPERVDPAPSSGTESTGQPPAMTVGAARAGTTERVNRPLAVSAVLAVASIVGAQIGAVLGLRRRPATAGAAPRLAAAGRLPRGGTGRTSGSTGRTTSTRRTSGPAVGSGAAWAAARTLSATEAATPPSGGTTSATDGAAPAGAADWAGDDGWSGDHAPGGLLSGGHGLDNVADGPPVGRHRRT
ncbi:hypothetical protein GCM10027614_46170 [Micromonospora vulcania]